MLLAKRKHGCADSSAVFCRHHASRCGGGNGVSYRDVQAMKIFLLVPILFTLFIYTSQASEFWIISNTTCTGSSPPFGCGMNQLFPDVTDVSNLGGCTNVDANGANSPGVVTTVVTYVLGASSCNGSGSCSSAVMGTVVVSGCGSSNTTGPSHSGELQATRTLVCDDPQIPNADGSACIDPDPTQTNCVAGEKTIESVSYDKSAPGFSYQSTYQSFKIASVAGCAANVTAVRECYSPLNQPSKVSCNFEYTKTGSPAASGASTPDPSTTPDSTNSTMDTATKTTTTTSAPSETVSNPDGSVDVTTDTTKVTSYSDGTSITDGPDTIIVTDSGPKSTTVQTKTTSRINSDGSTTTVGTKKTITSGHTESVTTFPKSGEPPITAVNTVPASSKIENTDTPPDDEPPPEEACDPKVENCFGTVAGPAVSVSWYETKYPQGVTQLFSNFLAENNNSTTAQWLRSWSLPSGGSFPTWNFNFDIPGMGNFGSGNLTPPAYVISAVRAIIILTGLFVARRIVFGG